MNNYYLVSIQGKRIEGVSEAPLKEFGAICNVFSNETKELVTGTLEGVQIYFSTGRDKNSSYLKVFKLKKGYCINAVMLKREYVTKAERIKNSRPPKVKVLDWWYMFDNIGDLEKLDNPPLADQYQSFLTLAKKNNLL